MNRPSGTIRGRLTDRRRVIGVVMAIACVALATVGVRYSEPSKDNFAVVKGTVGVPCPIESGELTVTKVQVATQIKHRDELVGETTGLFIVLTVAGAAPGTDSFRLGRSRLLADDAEYVSYLTSDTVSAEPGFVSTHDLVFEVDPNRIDNVTLEMWQGEIVTGYHERARIHLGITAANAQQWRDAARKRLVEVTTLPVVRPIA